MRLIGVAVLLALGLLTAPLVAEGQQVGKVPRIAFIFANQPEAEIAGPHPTSRSAQAFLDGMRQRGWVDGQNITIELRTVAGQPERYPAVAQEVVALHPDLIVLLGSGVSKVISISQKIPIVVVGGDLVGMGLAQSLAHPGGTVTGLTDAVSVEIVGKRLQLLKEAVPRASHVAVLSSLQIRPEVEAAGRALNLTLLPVDVPAPEGFATAFTAIKRAHVGAILVGGSPFFWGNRHRIIAFAAEERLPACYWDRIFAESGGLMSYGADYADITRRAASYVDKILRGAKPGDLPIEQPTRFELVINTKTAKALGLTIPQSLLLRADQIIE
jgi:putative tryptophan/tyrosine transport system substrate-binding protein